MTDEQKQYSSAHSLNAKNSAFSENVALLESYFRLHMKQLPEATSS